jgi:hypothetical protein
MNGINLNNMPFEPSQGERYVLLSTFLNYFLAAAALRSASAAVAAISLA